MRPRTLLPGAAALLLLAACGDSATTADPALLAADEAAALAADYEALAAEVVDALLGPTSAALDGAGARAAVTVDETFTRTRSCPLGGSVTLAGTMRATVDREARTMTRVTDATRTENGCTFRTRRGDATLTLDGSPNTAVHAEAAVLDGVRQPRTMTQVGRFTFRRSTGETGACDLDLRSTFDPATGIHRVTGTFCGRTVDVERQHGGHR